MSASTSGKYNVNDDKEAPKSRFSFIYDSRTGSCFGRTPKSWLLITVFYIIYYGCLAGFFTGMLAVFLFGVIQDERPHLTGEQSLLRLNPGMGFRPQPQPESSVIKFTAGKNDSYYQYTSNLEALYNAYKKPISLPNLRESCNENATGQDPTKVCPFDWDSELPDCVPANRFGYSAGRPCVVLKLNRVFGWLPDPVDQSVPHPTVRCFGENPADNENLGLLTYQPSSADKGPAGYFSQVYFPFLKQEEYQAPLVAVIFSNLPRNTLVMVECRLENLYNSKYDRADRQAMVRFDMFMQE